MMRAMRAWKLDSVTLTGDRTFPFRVEGENLNYPAGHMDRRFGWRVPNIKHGYDASDCALSPEVAEYLRNTGAVSELS